MAAAVAGAERAARRRSSAGDGFPAAPHRQLRLEQLAPPRPAQPQHGQIAPGQLGAAAVQRRFPHRLERNHQQRTRVFPLQEDGLLRAPQIADARVAPVGDEQRDAVGESRAVIKRTRRVDDAPAIGRQSRPRHGEEAQVARFDPPGLREHEEQRAHGQAGRERAEDPDWMHGSLLCRLRIARSA
jgi:hypothetical protein